MSRGGERATGAWLVCVCVCASEQKHAGGEMWLPVYATMSLGEGARGGEKRVRNGDIFRTSC